MINIYYTFLGYAFFCFLILTDIILVTISNFIVTVVFYDLVKTDSPFILPMCNSISFICIYLYMYIIIDIYAYIHTYIIYIL